MVYKLNSKKQYDRPEIYSKDGNVKIGIFEDLIISLNKVFQD